MSRWLSIPADQRLKGVSAVWEVEVPWKRPAMGSIDEPTDVVRVVSFRSGFTQVGVKVMAGEMGVEGDPEPVPLFNELVVQMSSDELRKFRDDLTEALEWAGVPTG